MAFSAPYIYCGLYKDEIIREIEERNMLITELIESEIPRIRECLKPALGVKLYTRGGQLKAIECYVCGMYSTSFDNLCEHTEGKLDLICAVFSVRH